MSARKSTMFLFTPAISYPDQTRTTDRYHLHALSFFQTTTISTKDPLEQEHTMNNVSSRTKRSTKPNPARKRPFFAVPSPRSHRR